MLHLYPFLWSVSSYQHIESWAFWKCMFFEKNRKQANKQTKIKTKTKTKKPSQSWRFSSLLVWRWGNSDIFRAYSACRKKKGFDISIHTSENVTTMVIHNNTQKKWPTSKLTAYYIDDFIFSSKHTRELLWIKSAIPNAFKSGNLPFTFCYHTWWGIIVHPDFFKISGLS